jgi:hypothetical protein
MFSTRETAYMYGRAHTRTVTFCRLNEVVEKLIVTPTVEKFFPIYRTLRLSAVFTRDCLLALSCAYECNPVLFYFLKYHSNFILSKPGLPNSLFLQVFQLKFCMHF